MGKNYNLALSITANTASAEAAVKRLTTDLRSLSTGGGGLGGALTSGTSGFASLGGTAKSVFGGIVSGVMGVGSVIKTVFGGALSAVKLGFGALAGAGATAAAALYAGYKAIQPAAQMEQYKVTLEVMLGTDEAQKRLAYLRDFAATTPFELPQVIEANNLMQAFGIYSERALTAAGDAASAFGRDLDEVVRSLNYLAAGRGGEAFESLARMGVTRDKLKPLGVQFSASGELISDTKQAFDAVITYFETNFGGMMQRQSKTFAGAFSNVKDAIFNAFADGGKGALAYLVPALQTASTLIGTLGAKIAAFDWGGIGAKFLAGFNAAANLVATLTSDTAQGKDARNSASNLAGAMWENLKNLPQAIGVSLGAFLGSLTSNLSTFAQLLIGGLAGVFQAAAQLFGAVLVSAWDALGRKLQDSLSLRQIGTTPEWKQARAEIEPLKTAAMVDFVKSQTANGVSEHFAIRNARQFVAPAFDEKIDARAKELRYGVNPVTPTGMQDVLKMTDSLSGGNGAAAALSALSGMGRIMKGAGSAAINAEGGVGDWWADVGRDFSGSNLVRGVKSDYATQLAAVPATLAQNAAPASMGGERTQQEQLAMLKAINAALREGVPAVAK